jgi:hypothetical protein
MANGWKNQNGNIATFDANGNILTKIERTWVNNAWVNDERYTYTYDAGNRELTALTEKWTNNAWVEDSKYITTYNGLGKVTEILMQVNNGFGLENSKRTTNSYNGNNALYERLKQVWVLSTTWLNDEIVEYTFDVSGNVATYSQSGWNSGTSAWEGMFRYVYTYDANNNQTVSLTQLFTNGAWVNESQGIYTYNANNRYSTVIGQKWVNNAWENQTKSDYTYDSNGWTIFSEAQKWAINTWQGDYKYVRTFTAFGNAATELYIKWINGAYVDYTRNFYYYENFENGLTGIAETPFAKTRLYPNPSGGMVNVEFAATSEELVTINLYSIAGELIQTQQARTNNGDNRFTFNTQNMPKGFYTVQLKATTAESNLKLVVN